MSGRLVGSWPTRILLVIAVALLSIWSAAATPSPALAGQGNVRYAYDGTNAEPGAAAFQRTVPAPDQRILGDRTVSAAAARGYDDAGHLARAIARPGGEGLAPRSTSLADDGLALCRSNSFVPATLVLMADGTTRPIADVQVGDLVMATDPETGEREPRKVTDTIVGDGIKELVDIEIDGHVITATDRHPFWVDDEGRWVDAEDLEAGDVLLLADGETVTVDAVRERTEVRRVHNLTVDGIHTYYVLAGEDPVLVHNCARPASRPRGLEPDTTATGPHSTFRRHGTTGEITHYATWQPQTNPMNPNAWELVHRVDVIGQPHFNKLLGEYVPTPHVQGPGIPGGVRPADPWEIPGGL